MRFLNTPANRELIVGCISFAIGMIAITAALKGWV